MEVARIGKVFHVFAYSGRRIRLTCNKVHCIEYCELCCIALSIALHLVLRIVVHCIALSIALH